MFDFLCYYGNRRENDAQRHRVAETLASWTYMWRHPPLIGPFNCVFMSSYFSACNMTSSITGTRPDCRTCLSYCDVINHLIRHRCIWYYDAVCDVLCQYWSPMESWRLLCDTGRLWRNNHTLSLLGGAKNRYYTTCQYRYLIYFLWIIGGVVLLFTNECTSAHSMQVIKINPKQYRRMIQSKLRLS